MIHQNNPNLSKINIINHGCAHFTIPTFSSHISFNIFTKTLSWLWNHIYYNAFHYFQIHAYYILLRVTIVKRQRKTAGSMWTKWIWNDISEKVLGMNYETMEMRMKAWYYKFIAMRHTCFYKVFLELFLWSRLLYGRCKKTSFAPNKIISCSKQLHQS